MSLEGFKKKPSVVVVFTGEGKGKTSASLGMMARSLGVGNRVAFVQFIKHWDVGEHHFIHALEPVFGDAIVFYKGGRGFFDAGDLSAKDTSQEEHIKAAQSTFEFALESACSGEFDLVICDEINNAEHDKLLPKGSIEKLIDKKHPSTSLCLSGRYFPKNLESKVDIVTNMTKIKHHFDDKFIANEGIDY